MACISLARSPLGLSVLLLAAGGLSACSDDGGTPRDANAASPGITFSGNDQGPTTAPDDGNNPGQGNGTEGQNAGTEQGGQEDGPASESGANAGGMVSEGTMTDVALDSSEQPAGQQAGGDEQPAIEGDQPAPGEQDPNAVPPSAPVNPNGTRNLFTDVLNIPLQEVQDKVQLAVDRFFGIGTGEPNTPIVDGGYRDYYELPQNPNQAFIWAADSNDIRSEGMSYGMMIAVQMDMQQQFDRLWNFARDFTQYRPGSNRDTIPEWRSYFRWRVRPNTNNANNWPITNVEANDGPAPDGEEYFAAALYLADRRWGSGGAINYEQEADAITAAMLNNPGGGGGRTPLFNAGANQVVFYPQGNLAQFSDPSYHLPAFYEQIFAVDGPPQDSARWLQIAETSRQVFVNSADDQTGLHPDYARFDGTPEQGGNDNAAHNEFRYDAWRVIMNIGVDAAWSGADPRLVTQAEKYHNFFEQHLGNNNVTEALFALDGTGRGGGGSTALTATLAAGVLASEGPLAAQYVENLWNVGQQQGEFRYYQECVYLLGLLAASGNFSYDWQ